MNRVKTLITERDGAELIRQQEINAAQDLLQALGLYLPTLSIFESGVDPINVGVAARIKSRCLFGGDWYKKIGAGNTAWEVINESSGTSSSGSDLPYENVPTGAAWTIPTGRQANVIGGLTLNGSVTVIGHLIFN